jgi:TetR/AcrR family transcriptional regulator
MGEVRDAARTRAKIVAAATDEFADKGFTGARVEAIGRRAGVNKQLLYHYFGNKEELFRAVLDGQLARNAERQATMPADPTRFPESYFRWLLDDEAWVRFLTWEAAAAGDGEVPAEPERRRSIAGFAEELRARQVAGELSSDLDPRLLLLAVYALTTYPLAFPQITRMTTGLAATDPEFHREWSALLRRFGAALLAPPNTDRPPSQDSDPLGSNDADRSETPPANR